ncbi:MAG: IclR family transcriptional regulator [Actinobacteria bacterium]|nr:IclR family transcriptional regulator [Actinomycetota bacterium]
MTTEDGNGNGNGPRGATRVQSVERAARLLMLVARDSTDGTGTGLAKAAGLAVPTGHHLLSTLVAEGLLARDEFGRYILGPAVSVLADAYHETLAVPDYLSRPLQGLAQTTGETTYLVGWRGSRIELLRRVEGNLPVRVSMPTTGVYHDAHARAGGKAVLAELPDPVREEYLAQHPLRPVTTSTITDRRRFETELALVRSRGWAVDEEEFTPGVCCIAAAVPGEAIQVAYAMSLPAQRYAERREELVQALTAAARSVAEVLATYGSSA